LSDTSSNVYQMELAELADRSAKAVEAHDTREVLIVSDAIIRKLLQPVYERENVKALDVEQMLVTLALAVRALIAKEINEQ
jgi:hypothetical protein